MAPPIVKVKALSRIGVPACDNCRFNIVERCFFQDHVRLVDLLEARNVHPRVSRDYLTSLWEVQRIPGVARIVFSYLRDCQARPGAPGGTSTPQFPKPAEAGTGKIVARLRYEREGKVNISGVRLRTAHFGDCTCCFVTVRVVGNECPTGVNKTRLRTGLRIYILYVARPYRANRYALCHCRNCDQESEMRFSQVWKDVTPVSGSKSFIGPLIVMWASHL